MNRIRSQVTVAILLAGFAKTQAATVYQNNFDSGNSSLSGFEPFGMAEIGISAGQVEVGVSGFNRGGISLNTATVAGYATTLSSNLGMVTWAFNVSNSDGMHNNAFFAVLAGSASNPFISDVPVKGYSFKGGGFVGDRMLLSRFDPHLNSSQILIEVPSRMGLGPLPQTGTVRITYDPGNDVWSLYMDAGPNPGDPTVASQFLGAAVDGTYTHSELPFFSLGAETSGTAYFDNLSISVVPEASSFSLAVGGLSILF